MIPDYQTIMLPLLKLTADGSEHAMRELIDLLAKQFELTEDERKQMQPSRSAVLFDNRCHWARKYLVEAAVLEASKRAHVRITDRGKQLLASNPAAISTKLLRQYPEFLEFAKGSGESAETPAAEPVLEVQAPDEVIRAAFNRIHSLLVTELLGLVKKQTPVFFEQLVLDLLRAMGYGGIDSDSVSLTKTSGDEGIDGLIFEDKLGLDTIYVQAKRWDQGTVGRPEIQKFVGALHGQRAKKGVFITTSRFSAEAQEYIQKIDPKVVLIDGQKLAQYMIEFGVGVSSQETFVIKRIDLDYFDAG